MKLEWQGIGIHESKNYVCGYCGESISSEKAYYATSKSANGVVGYVYICHHCYKPTFFDILNYDKQTPGASFGNNVNGIDNKNIEELYTEARNCYSTNGFTSVVLACRKLLMHIAVSQGAKEGLSFIQYVEYLADKNFIPPGAKGWVDHIRAKGNEANHEITIMTKVDAEDLLSFIEMLLKIIYEFPANIKNKKIITN